MSVFSAMRTSVSGMNAQASRISTFSENIANSDTVGYKAATAQFRTMLINGGGNDYTSGGVNTRIRYGIDQQGILSGTGSASDIGIQGRGFFVVADASGNPHLTRAGSFVPDAAGYLVNAAGFRLLGVASGVNAAGAATGFSGLSEIKINMSGLVAAPSTRGSFAANLPSSDAIVPSSDLPSTNAATALTTQKSSMVVFGDLGDKVTLDVYFSKTAANRWEVAVFDQSRAAPGGGFPYQAGPLAVQTLQFDPKTGKLPEGAARDIAVSVPGGETLQLDLAGMTQLAAGYSVAQVAVDGNAPSRFNQIKIGADGDISAVYQNGMSVSQYQVRLATVPSVHNLTPLSGNIYDVTAESGDVLVGSPGSGALGLLVSSALEDSTVDVATELTGMIETQRAYTANSKAFQVATDITDVLVNLKV